MKKKNCLKEIRLKRGMAIQGLAVKAQASPSMISAIEKWGYRPSPATQRRLAQALRVPVSSIWQLQKKSEGSKEA